MKFRTEKTCISCNKKTKNAFFDGKEIIAICKDCQDCEDELIAKKFKKGK